MAQTLKFGNGTWATKKGSTLAYNDEDGNYKPLPFAYTGAGKGTRVNKQGLIEVVENDRPRIDYLDSEDGVFLLEKAATNLVTYSEDFSQSYWSKLGASVVSNSTISPDGTLNASKLIEGTNNGTHILYRNNIVTGAGQNTLSVKVKADVRNWVLLYDAEQTEAVYFDLENGVAGSTIGSPDDYSITALPNGWYDISLTTTAISKVDFQIYTAENDGVYIYQGDGVSGIYVWGAQLESGNVASSYIPTQGSAVTRVAETASGSGNSEVFNDSEGVLFADIAANANDGIKRSISINDGSSANRFILRFGVNDNTIEFVSSSNNSAVLLSSVAVAGGLSSIKVAAKWDSNNYVFYVNGIIETTKNDLITPLVLNNLDFNDGNNNFNPFYGKTKELGCYDTALTNAELETLTSYRTWLSMVNELNLNVIYNG